MYDDAGKTLGAYMSANSIFPSGPWSVIYFKWNEATGGEGGQAEIGIAFPIQGIMTINNPEQNQDLSIVDVHESPAAMMVLEGSYDGLGEAHGSMMKYAMEKGYDMSAVPVLAVEEYLVGPMQDPNPANWRTNIYYLHK